MGERRDPAVRPRTHPPHMQPVATAPAAGATAGMIKRHHMHRVTVSFSIAGYSLCTNRVRTIALELRSDATSSVSSLYSPSSSSSCGRLRASSEVSRFRPRSSAVDPSRDAMATKEPS